VLSLDGEGEWWANFLRALPLDRRPRLGRIVALNHVRGIINAAMAGLGVGLVPTYTVLRELEDGRLLGLFPDLELLEDRFRVVCKRSRSDEPAIRALREFLLTLEPGELGDAIGRPVG
jgi:DNA-binding transcriptional LysR family regulator